jgi:hypothetical protein
MIQIYVPQMYRQFDIYEIEKNRQYVVQDHYRKAEVQENGLPTNCEIHYVMTEQEAKELFKRFESYHSINVFPATFDQIQKLYEKKPYVEGKTKFLCDKCVEIEGCPRFTETERYVSLYDRSVIFDGYSYYRGLAFHATVLNCPSFKPGKVPRGRGFAVEVKRCEDCPWHEEERIPDDNSSHHCDKACKEIQSSRDAMVCEINYIPNWCPMLPENQKKT